MLYQIYVVPRIGDSSMITAKNFLPSCALALLSTTLIGCPLLGGANSGTWQFKYDIIGSPSDIVKTHDGGVLILLAAADGIVKIDDSGEVVFLTGIDSGGTQYACPVGDTGFVAIGQYKGDNAILRLTVNGNLAWALKVDPSALSLMSGISCVDVDAFWVGAHTRLPFETSSPNATAATFASFSANADLYVQYTMGVRETDDYARTHSVLALASGAVAATGAYIDSENPDNSVANSHTYLLVLDANGNEVFTKIYDTATIDTGYDLIELSDGGFAIVGTVKYPTTGVRDILIVRTDLNGNVLWDRIYGGVADEIGSSIVELSNGDLIVGGTTTSFGAGAEDMYLLRVNASGEVVWEKTFGDSLRDVGAGVVLADDGNILFAGSESGQGIQARLRLLKVGPNGTISRSEEIVPYP